MKTINFLVLVFAALVLSGKAFSQTTRVYGNAVAEQAPTYAAAYIPAGVYAARAIQEPARGDVQSEFDAVEDCRCKGIKLYGRVQIVESFPDLKVMVVESFPDLRVKSVGSFPDECGKWQFVTSFPDFKIKFVTSFSDLKIKFVDSFPGPAAGN